MVKRSVILALLLLVVFSACNVTKRIVKDIPIEQMDELRDKYKDRTAWTRAVLVDLGPEGIVDRDTKVKIVDLDMHWSGAITVQGPNRRRITHGLNLERPLTREAYEDKLQQLFWFKHPDYRYRMDLRNYGKKTAKAIYNHELFKGMKRDAALASWGYPDEMKSHEMSGTLEEQWIYIDQRQKGKKRYIYIRDGAVDHWEE